MDEIELLGAVLDKTANLIDGVGANQWSLPTPCPEYDVDARGEPHGGVGAGVRGGQRRATTSRVIRRRTSTVRSPEMTSAWRPTDWC